MVLLPPPPVHQVKGYHTTTSGHLYPVCVHSSAALYPLQNSSPSQLHRLPSPFSAPALATPLSVYEMAALGTVCEWNHSVLLGPTCHTEHGAFSLQPCCRCARIPFLNKQNRVPLCGVSCFSTCPQMGTWAWTSTKGPWHCGPFLCHARDSTGHYIPHCFASSCPHGCELRSLKGMKVKRFLEGGTLRSPQNNSGFPFPVQKSSDQPHPPSYSSQGGECGRMSSRGPDRF